MLQACPIRQDAAVASISRRGMFLAAFGIMEASNITIATRGHSTNLIGLPTGLLASCSFNSFPLPLHISGTREAHRGLFDRLATIDAPDQAASLFQDYMNVAFALDGQRAQQDGARRYRSSYLKLLADWGFDANSPAGAVLKGWVESRFGLFPTYHREPVTRFNSPAWITYVEEKMSHRYHNNSINMQLDLLYEFCQWSLARFFAGCRHMTMYRGTNDLSEFQLQQRLNRRIAVVRLNNLVSFSTARDIADEFGDSIIEAEVPTVKILLHPRLLSRNPLPSEAECLVIGGDYQVRISYW